MNKFLVLFAALLLVGGGCAATNTEPTTDTPVDNTMEEPHDGDTMMEKDPENGEEKDEKELTNAGSEDITATIVTDQGIELEVNVDPKDEGITEVPLGGTTSQEVSMESGNFFFKPNVINAKTGEKVTISIAKNSGFHTFVIDELNIKEQISDGKKFAFITPDKPGTYAFYCDVGSHRELGMEGTLIVK